MPLLAPPTKFTAGISYRHQLNRRTQKAKAAKLLPRYRWRARFLLDD
jgi:hypothetical protein